MPTIHFRLIILLSILGSCSSKRNVTLNMDDYKLKNYDSIISNYLLQNNIVLQAGDTIILFDSEACPQCIRNSSQIAILEVDRKNYSLIVFTKEDKTFFSDKLKNMKILLLNKKYLQKQRIDISKPYKYYLNQNKELKSTPLY